MMTWDEFKTAVELDGIHGSDVLGGIEWPAGRSAGSVMTKRDDLRTVSLVVTEALAATVALPPEIPAPVLAPLVVESVPDGF